MSASKKRKKRITITFRITDDQRTTLIEKAGSSARSIGQYARDLALLDNGHALERVRRPPPRDALELRRLVAAIGKIGSNLNQLARSNNTPDMSVDRDLLAVALRDLAAMRRALTVVLGVRDP